MRRRSLRVALAVALSALLSAPALAQNLVVNGGFEDGINNWQWFGLTAIGNVATTSTDTPSGTGSSADLDIVEALGLPWLIQDVDISSIPTGTELTLTASVREVRQFLPEFDAWIASQMYLLPSSESGSILASGFAFYTSPTWQTQSFTVAKPAGANVARVLFTPQDPSFGVGTGRYLIDNVSLTAPSAGLSGDFNGDGRVDGGDLSLLLANWGATVPPNPSGWTGDAPTATGIDADELSRLLANWGTGTSTAIPEPTAFVSVVVMGSTMLPFGRRRRTNA